jgi:pectate lyase
MKKVFFVLFALCLVSSLAFAAEYTSTATVTDASTAAATEMSTTATTGTTTPASATVTTASATPMTTTVTTSTVATTPETVVLKGDVIDNTCANANRDKLAEFVKTHTKQCALMPGCVESGYSFYANGKLYAFDKDSNAKIVEFLKKADSKLQVAITAKQVGDELSLVSIENQK